MREVRRKVLLDLFAAPATLVPIVAGATALLTSWAVGGHPLLTFGGIAGVLGGAGMFASRLIFGLESLTERAYQYVMETQQARQLEALQELHARLLQDRDERTQALLSQLRSLYATVKDDIQQGKITISAHEVLEGVDRMFKVCLEYLDRSYQLWQTSLKLRGPARQRVLKQREELITEVAHSVSYLESTVDQLQVNSVQKSKSQLAEIRAELDETLRVARRAEQRARELDWNPTPDPDDVTIDDR